METVIIEVYYLLGRVDIWTCRRNIIIQIERRREDVPLAVIQALEYLPQTKVIPQGDDLLNSAISSKYHPAPPRKYRTGR